MASLARLAGVLCVTAVISIAVIAFGGLEESVAVGRDARRLISRTFHSRRGGRHTQELTRVEELAQELERMISESVDEAVVSKAVVEHKAIKTSCNWGSSYVPCYDLPTLQDDTQYFVGEIWAGNPDHLGLHELVQWPMGGSKTVEKTYLWMTHQEQGTLIRMTFEKDVILNKDAYVTVFPLPGKGRFKTSCTATTPEEYADCFKQRSNGVHGLIWTGAYEAWAICEYQQAIVQMKFDKDYDSIVDYKTYLVDPQDKGTWKDPTADKNHGEKCGIADYDSGIHTLIAVNAGDPAKFAIYFTMKFGKQTLDPSTKKANRGSGCIGRLTLDEHGDGKFYYWKVAPLFDEKTKKASTKLPLPFYIDKSAGSEYVWFNSITSDQMGYLDVAKDLASDEGPKSVALPALPGAAESARGFGTTDVRPGGFVVLDDGTVLFAVYNRHGSIGRITLDSKGATSVDYLFKLADKGAYLHLQVNDKDKCTTALGKGAEEKGGATGCDLYLVASANDFGGEAEAGTELFSVAEERDRLIILKDVRLLPETGRKAGEVATHDASKRVDVEAPTQKSWIHRVTPLFNLERQRDTALLAATELRTNRVLIVSPKGGAIDLTEIEKAEKAEREAHKQTHGDDTNDKTEVTRPRGYAMSRSSSFQTGPQEVTAPLTLERTRRYAGGHKSHTLEKPLLEPQAKMRSDAEFEPIRGFEIFPTGWAPAPKVIPRRGLFRRRTSHRRHRAAAD